MSPKRTAAMAILAVLMIVVIPVSFFAAQPEPASAESNDIVSCQPRGSNIVCSVLGEGVILTVPIPTIKVPGPTIKVPGPTVTVRPDPIEVPVPGPTRTVEIPGPTETVTVRPNNPQPSQAPGETETVTAQPEPQPTGQPTGPRGTLTSSPEPEVVTETETRTKTETIVRGVLLGTLASIAFAALGILALFLGYLLGQRDAKKNEDRFLESLLDSVRLSKRPIK